MRFLDDIKRSLPTPESKVFYTTNPNVCQVKKMSNAAGAIPLNLRRYQEYFFVAFQKRLPASKELARLVYLNFHPLIFLSPEFVFGSSSSPAIQWKNIYASFAGRPMYRMLAASSAVLPDQYFIEKRPLPRCWICRGYTVITQDQKVLQTLADDRFDPRD
jgi:hypothetical protein